MAQHPTTHASIALQSSSPGGPLRRLMWQAAFCLALSLQGMPLSAHAADGLYVVVSAQHPVKTISQKEVLALFTGRSRTLSDGTLVTPVDQRRDGTVRSDFYQALTGMDIAHINSYWARLHFSGQVQPPMALDDDASVTRWVRNDSSAIGYLTQKPSDPALRVVLHLPPPP